MKKIFINFILIVFLLLPSISSAIVLSQGGQDYYQRVYVYFVKNFYQGFDCSKPTSVVLLFEFNSKENNEKKFNDFINNYIQGMKDNNWKTAYFYDYARNKHKKNRKCREKVFKEILIPPDFVYFESRENRQNDNCYFNKLLEPFSGNKIDVSVEFGDNREKTVSYLDFYEKSRIQNQVNKYKGDFRQYAKMVSEKIDSKVYSLYKLQAQDKCW